MNFDAFLRIALVYDTNRLRTHLLKPLLSELTQSAPGLQMTPHRQQAKNIVARYANDISS